MPSRRRTTDEAEQHKTIPITVDGKTVSVDIMDIDGLEWRDAKNAARMSEMELVRGLMPPLDFEAVAAILWIWRRRKEPELTYEEVLGSLSYRSVADVDGKEKPADPPA